MLRFRLLSACIGLIWLCSVVPGTAAKPADRLVLIDDWTTDPVGRRGVPSEWAGESLGRRATYDFTIEQTGGAKVLHMKSSDEHSTIGKNITGQVNLRETPILEWTWKAVTLPAGADLRHKETTDIAVQLYVVWPRFPALLRSRIIGYVWDAATPAETIVKSEKTGTVTFVVLRSGPQELGRWLSERRNVVVDYTAIFHELPDEPRAIGISIDSNDTHWTAESFIGPIAFRSR